MKKVIFICRGNVFRSQIARGIYNKLAYPLVAESYGTCVEKDGLANSRITVVHGMEHTVDMLKEEGIDIGGEYCKQVTPENLKGATKIIMMAERDLIPEWLNKYEYEYWEVPNPTVVTSEIARSTIELLREKVRGLVNS